MAENHSLCIDAARRSVFSAIPQVVRSTLSLIQGKYKMVTLYCLMGFQPVRFNELRRYLKTVFDKTLSRALKELEADGPISRAAYPQIPPKVEYRLTERGASLMEVLDAMCAWGSQNRDWKPGC